MPLRGERSRLCIIGDSHLGSVRNAEKSGIVDLSDYEVEYWGAVGPAFREMIQKDGRIVVKGREAREQFAAINERNRTEIAVEDFDEYLFFGARVRSSEFFGRHLQRMLGCGAWYSRAAMALSAKSFLASSKAYRIASAFAREYGARVAIIPSPLITADIVDLTRPGFFLDLYPDAVRAQPEHRDALWAVLIEAAAADGVRLIRQPDDTIVQGVFTDPVYAIESAHERQDPGHKSPAFAARMLSLWKCTASAPAGSCPS